mgnify:CR=1 FL=1
MMNDRQKNYRQEYRSRLSSWYNGPVHVMVVYTIGLTALWIFSQHLHNVQWWEWAMVPLFFIGANIFEWYLHLNIMHRPQKSKALRAIYNRHTLQHHQFFTDNEMRFRNHKDWRVTVFPPYAIVVLILIVIPGATLLHFVLTPNIGWLFISTTTSIYLIYEFMHFCCHTEENWFVQSMPFVNTIRLHHTAHHNSRLMMEKNMNLTFPISDWLFGTSDLDRGLLGHIFNGYSDEHLKSDLRGKPVRPDVAAAEPLVAEAA